MTDSDSVMIIHDDDEHDFRLYIDENTLDTMTDQQQTKSTSTDNPFELDFSVLAHLHRYRTRSSQTVLTSDVSLLRQRDRSTFCQAEYFATMTQQTNTDHDVNQKEEYIPVVKKQRT